MGQVLIRNLDDSVIRAIKLKAELKGHSLEQELRDIIGRAAPLTPRERVDAANRIVALQTKAATEPSEALLRRARDEHRS
jgi:antitoxin FitA